MTKFERIARESTIPTSIFAIALILCGCSKSPGDLVAEGNRQLQSRQFTDAALTFRKAIQIEPNNGKAHFGLAKVLAQGQNTSELYRELSEAVVNDPTNRDARKMLIDLALVGFMSNPKRPAELRYKLENLAAAEIASDNKSFEAWKIKGFLAGADQDRPLAIECFKKALLAKPNENQVTRELAILLNEDPALSPQGEELLRNLIAAHPDDGLAYDTLAKFLLTAGRTPEAEKLLEAKIQSNPSEGVYVAQLAEFHRRQGKAEKATILLENMANERKRYPLGRLVAGNYYAEAEQWKLAIELYESGWKDGGTEKLAYGRQLARALNASKQNEKALEVVNEALKLDAKDVELRTVRALLYLQKRDPKTALEQLQALSSEAPESAAIQFHLGRALDSFDDPKAKAAWMKAVQLNPRFTEPRIALSRLALRSRQFQEAMDLANTVLEISPGNAEAVLVQVGALEAMGKMDQAQAALRNLARRFPDLKALDIEQGYLSLRLQRPVDAEASFRKVYVPGSEDARILAGLTRAMMANGKTAEAVRLLESEYKLSPSGREVRYLLAEAYLATRQTPKALPILDKLHADHPDFTVVGLRLSALQSNSGDMTGAIRTLLKTRDAAQDKTQVLATLAQAYQRAGNWAESKAAYREVLKMKPDNVFAMNGLAYLLSEHGEEAEMPEALRLALRAKSAAPNDPNVTDTLGLVHLRRKDFKSAAGLFREALKGLPANAEIRSHLDQAMKQLQ